HRGPRGQLLLTARRPAPSGAGRRCTRRRRPAAGPETREYRQMNGPHSSTRSTSRRRRRGLAPAGAATALAMVAALAAGAAPSVAGEDTETFVAQAADPLRDGLVAEYLFEETGGATVHNTADGAADAGDPLDAVIHNYADGQRTEPGTLQLV